MYAFLIVESVIMRRFWRRERNDQQSAEKAQWVFADGDTEDVDEDDKRRYPAAFAHSGIGIPECDNPKHDVNHQQDNLGHQPRMIAGRIAQDAGECKGADQQQGINDMWQDLYQFFIQPGRLSPHPDTANKKADKR